tara:strand:- start:288 stop:641 length:354 start_codon:yes stop_codon:yes gene_type:complete
MSIKIALLKSGEYVISDAKELISEDKVCGYLLKKPHTIDIREPVLLTEEDSSESSSNLEISLSPWIVLSKEDQIPLSPDWIVTIVEPIDSVKELYEEKINGIDNQVGSSNQQTNLSE